MISWIDVAASHVTFVTPFASLLSIPRGACIVWGCPLTSLWQELEAPTEMRRLGSGWISGTLALALSILGLGTVLCLRYPQLLTVPAARGIYDERLIRPLLAIVLINSFALAMLSVVLRKQKVLGFTSISFVFVAVAFGGPHTVSRTDVQSEMYLGLDWFLISLVLTGIVFIPIERIVGNRDQPIFRFEWREDLLYFLIGTLFVQGLAFLSLVPGTAIRDNTDWGGFRQRVDSQWVIVQFLEITLLTDLVQYWVHRAFHQVSWLWKFHAVHHSAQVMDWLASSRMHLVEIVVVRGFALMPIFVLGFGQSAYYMYLVFEFFLTAMVHSNARITFGVFDRLIVTPRFHHWHHGIEKEAIDVNFAIHFSLLDRVFGTFHLPADGRWPSGYGINRRLPPGYGRQFLYPFTPSLRASDNPTTSKRPAGRDPTAIVGGAKLSRHN
jgi:sterol desaturase/sphingolipid hydroxylase (fatty acid hydroxylase superfamily)